MELGEMIGWIRKAQENAERRGLPEASEFRMHPDDIEELTRVAAPVMRSGCPIPKPAGGAWAFSLNGLSIVPDANAERLPRKPHE